MGHVFRSLVAALLMAFPAVAQEAQPRNPDIEAVIGSQLEAFKVDDFATAFGFAAPGIQGMFGTPDNFGLMVRRGYPMVCRPGQVQYLELREIAGSLWQRVEIIDREGRLHRLDYQMREGPDGWKIGAVQILPTPDVAV